MNTKWSVFLVGALVGAAVALGLRAGVERLDAGTHHHVETPAPKVEPAPAPEPVPEPEPKGFLIDLGNVNCPIMGKPANGVTWSEWKGLRVGHCCPPCVKKFLADPEKHLDAAGVEWREAAEMVVAVERAEGAVRTGLLEEAKKRFTVVREP